MDMYALFPARRTLRTYGIDRFKMVKNHWPNTLPGMRVSHQVITHEVLYFILQKHSAASVWLFLCRVIGATAQPQALPRYRQFFDLLTMLM